MKYGFLRAATVSPGLRVADVAYNTQEIIKSMREKLRRHEESHISLPSSFSFCLNVSYHKKPRRRKAK